MKLIRVFLVAFALCSAAYAVQDDNCVLASEYCINSAGCGACPYQVMDKYACFGGYGGFHYEYFEGGCCGCA